MAIILDGQPMTDCKCGCDATVGEVIDEIKTDLHDSGSIILGIACNSEKISAEKLDQVLCQRANQFDRLEFFSGEPRQVVLETLEQTRKVFLDSFATLKQVADDLTTGNIAGGMSGLAGCIRIWEDVHEVIVRGGALVHVDFESVVVDQRPLLDCLKDLSVRLGEVRDAIEARDHVLLADILHYELDETLRGWERMLDAFMAHVKNPAGDEIATSSAPPP